MKRPQETGKKNRISRNAILWCLATIAIVGFCLRIVNLTVPDIAGDDALYAMRSVGWIDYVAATNRQSTPVSWFAEKQWWQGLSFHDAPPLVFAVQWFFFKIGGVNPWAARLPFVLAGMLAIFALFLVGRELGGPLAGLASAAALAVMNYAVFASRIGILDGFLVFWIALALYFFLKAEKRPPHYLWWGVCLGAGLLTKYTFIFILPAFLLILVVWRRRAFRQGQLYASIAACLALLAPVIIYNIEMLRTRGHLDAALATLIGQHPADFSGLTRALAPPANPLSSLVGLLQRNISIGFLILLGMSVLALGYRIARDKTRRAGYALIITGLIMALVALGFLGVADRFGVIIVPFAALLLGLGAVWISEYTPRHARMIFLAFVTLALLGEAIVTVQTQWLAHPIVPSPILAAGNRPVFAGYRLLDQYVGDFYRRFPEPSPIVIFQDEPQLAAYQRARIETRLTSAPDGPFQKHLLVFDDRMRWFAWVWIFERRRLYDASPIHSIGQFVEKIETRGPAFYTALGLEDVTIIIVDDHLLEDTSAGPDNKRTLFAHTLAAKAKPIDEIRDPDGRLLFSVFRLPLATAPPAPAPATRSPQ